MGRHLFLSDDLGEHLVSEASGLPAASASLPFRLGLDRRHRSLGGGDQLTGILIGLDRFGLNDFGRGLLGRFSRLVLLHRRLFGSCLDSANRLPERFLNSACDGLTLLHALRAGEYDHVVRRLAGRHGSGAIGTDLYHGSQRAFADIHASHLAQRKDSNDLASRGTCGRDADLHDYHSGVGEHYRLSLVALFLEENRLALGQNPVAYRCKALVKAVTGDALIRGHGGGTSAESDSRAPTCADDDCSQRVVPRAQARTARRELLVIWIHAKFRRRRKSAVVQ